MKLRVFLLTTSLILLAWTSPFQQEPPPVTAEVEPRTLTTDETLTLTITVHGGGAQQPKLPPLDGFQVVASSTASQFQLINGEMRSQTVYRFTLRPTRSGSLVIPPLQVSVGGQVYTTPEFSVEVEQGRGAPQGAATPAADAVVIPPAEELKGQDLYVEAQVDNPHPYLGEQVNYSFRFYRAITLFEQPSYQAPDFAGFWHEQLDQQKEYRLQVADRQYRVIELQTILFPTTVGELTIEPASLTIPGSLFSRGVTLQTYPVQVEVRALPQPPAEGFRGAVGRFSVSASLDDTQVLVNEPLTLRFTVEGQGNIDALPEPQWPEVEGWRAFDAAATSSSQISDGFMGGSRVFERLLVPVEAGSYTVPPIAYTFFDPQTATYQTVTSDPLQVTVLENPSAFSAPQRESSPQEVTARERDIHHIKPVPPRLQLAAPPWADSPAYWLLWLLPLLALVGDWFWLRRQRLRAQNPAWVRRTRALKRAQAQLKSLRETAGDPHLEVGRVLITYLSDKLGRPLSGLTLDSLSDLLHREGVEGALVSQIREILTLSEMGRYAPSGMEVESSEKMVIRRAQEILLALENAFRDHAVR